MYNELIFGKRIIISNSITKNVQSRTHKRKRINKKWIKRYGYKSVPDDSKIISTDDYLFMTERAYKKIQKHIIKETENESN